MNQHAYLRAYMAGIVLPTILLIGVATAFCIARYVYNIPVPVERVIVFPMAVVPNLWGLWNMLFIGSHARTHLSIGLHGAVLPVLLGPLGFLLTRILDFPVPHDELARILPILGPIALIAYYLVWKYVVGFLNGILGIA
jgi:ABC-type sulfate transport system permease subunit